MALVLKKLCQGYFYAFNDLADRRTDNYLLLSTPLLPAIFFLGYLYIVKYLGPKLMKNRKPFKILQFIRIYNAIQVILNAYVAIRAVKQIFHLDLNCAPAIITNNPHGDTLFHICYTFYILKILDLLDTLFFVLRKSDRQITFLHVYHHAGMLILAFVGTKFLAAGESMWIPTINSFVHVIMYSYYFLATIDDKWKNVKYKKILTQIQLAQFATLFYLYGRLLFKPDCAYPKWVSYALVPQNAFITVLFLDFYIKTYVRNKKDK